MNSIITPRLTEIEEHVAANDLDAATRRLMDFVSDFGTDKRHRRQVISLRGTYNEYRESTRISGKTRRNDNLSRELRHQILEIADEIAIGLENISPKVMKSENIVKNNQRSALTIPDELSTNNIPQETFEKAEYFPTRLESKQQHDNSVACDCIRISKTYAHNLMKFTLHPVSLQLKLGEITALVGENGSGKTTLLKIISGYIKATKGNLFYPILPIDRVQDPYSIKQNLAYIPQELPPWSGSLADNLRFSAGLRDLHGEKNEQEVEFIISRLGLQNYKDAKWSEISSGFKTRFALAKALLSHPKLLVLDEPLANLDVNTQTIFLQDLRDLSNSISHPMSVVISSQHLHEIEDIADNILFLRGGAAIYNGPVILFGEDRKENSFELACNLSKNELIDQLDKINYHRVEQEGSHYIVHTPRDITEHNLLQTLLSNKVNIKLFRDISKSTRKLFSEAI